MQLISAEVTNFRALQDITVHIDADATLIVGRNNSGKTSFVDLFARFFGKERPRFTWTIFRPPESRTSKLPCASFDNHNDAKNRIRNPHRR
jgi:predicted ATP-dependent endonuclease of OLD family